MTIKYPAARDDTVGEYAFLRAAADKYDSIIADRDIRTIVLRRNIVFYLCSFTLNNIITRQRRLERAGQKSRQYKGRQEPFLEQFPFSHLHFLLCSFAAWRDFRCTRVAPQNIQPMRRNPMPMIAEEGDIVNKNPF